MIWILELKTRSRFVAMLKVEQVQGYWRISSDGQVWTLDGAMALHQVVEHEAYQHGKNDDQPLSVDLKRWR